MIGGREKDRNLRHTLQPRVSEDESVSRKGIGYPLMSVNCTIRYTFKSCNRL